MTEKFICIHGHFYQPPRENPWIEEVEYEDSAHPYHDWNTRITAECYEPNSASRIMDPEARIIGVVNNYSKISFNFGPTLLSWIARFEPQLYNSILAADKESSSKHNGHGGAIAQVYNHMIMPLANIRDKETQIKWGIADFEKRFERQPEGMWLPETAVDIETLDLFAENNIKFTILGPHQASRVRKLEEKDWTDVKGSKIDPRRPYVCKMPSGRTIVLFFFDSLRTSEATFGNLLSSGETYAKRLFEGFKGAEKQKTALVSMASDGEIYGHHRPHGDMALAYCLYYIESMNLAKITNYAEFLSNNPPEYEVEIIENTSWSCAHGIERWRSDCGDNTGRPGWKQQWRKPLRDAMNWLRDELAPRFETEAKKHLKDPWLARNDYIDIVLDRSKESIEKFLAEQANRLLNAEERKLVLKLLEMQRQTMLMFTSCGWFFDEISGIETVQVMEYAARAMQLAQQVFGIQLEHPYIKILEQAVSNIPEFGNGAEVYAHFVKPSSADLAKIAAQGTIQQLFSKEKTDEPSSVQQYGCCFKMTNQIQEKFDAGKFRLVLSYCKVQSIFTEDEGLFACAALWLGDHNVSCSVKTNASEAEYTKNKSEILPTFNKGQINETILLISKVFGGETYSLKDLFKDDQIRILDTIIQSAIKKANELNEIIYRDNIALLKFMNGVGVPSPKQFKQAAEIVLNNEIMKNIAAEDTNPEMLSRQIAELKLLSVEFDAERISVEASKKIVKHFEILQSNPADTNLIEKISKLIEAFQQFPVKLDLWHAQNTAFAIAQNLYRPIKEKEDGNSQNWVLAFEKLCKLIGIRPE